MALTKVTSGGMDGTFPDDSIVNADINSSAAIAMSKLATDPTNASNLASGTVPTARLGSGSASSSVFLAGDNTWASAGDDNTPAFHVRLTNTQSLATNTWAKVEFNQVDWQTGSTFDNTTNYRWTPGVAGKYFLYANGGVPGIDDNEDVQYFFKKNTAYCGGQINWWSSGADHYIKGSTVVAVDSSSTDYFEFWMRQHSGDSQNLVNDEHNAFFGGFRIIGA